MIATYSYIRDVLLNTGNRRNNKVMIYFVHEAYRCFSSNQTLELCKIVTAMSYLIM